jgi:hypothetical protein
MPDASPPHQDATLGGVALDGYPHVCAFVGDLEEEQALVRPFIAEALDAGEQVFFVHAPGRRDEVLGFIGERAVEAVERDQLVLLDWEDAYLQDGHFDAQRMLALLERHAGSSREAGYPRARFVGHMGWVAGGRPGVGDAVEYEARVNAVLARQGTPAVCVYPMDSVQARMLVDLMAVHPVLLLNGEVYRSPFFIEPHLYLASRGRDDRTNGSRDGQGAGLESA